MRSSPFTALYDACVLYPAPLRDLLLRLGLTGLFDAFVEDLCDLDAALVVESARKQRNALRHPPVDVDDYLAMLARQGLPNSTRFLSGFRAIL